MPPSDNQPKGEGKRSPAARSTPAPSNRKCYRSGTINARPGSSCANGGWAFEEYSGGKIAFCTNGYKPLLEMPCPDEQPKPPKEPKQPKQPEQKEPKKPNPNDGKQPKHEDGKQPKGEGQGDDKGEKQPKGEGQGDDKGEKQPKGEGSGDSSGDNGGKGSKGEGNGKGEGSGDGQGNGKGWWKGAGDGRIGDVRVPHGQGDGIGWRGDFFLRNANQCPQDKVLTLMGKQVVFSYANICKYLDMISPIVKAICMFVAGMMVVRSIRAK